MFAGADFVTYYGDDDREHLPASVEGGDVHVIGNRTVMIGMGERTTPMGAEVLTSHLFASGQVDRVIAIELPKAAFDDAPRHRDDDDRPDDLRPLPVLRPPRSVLDDHTGVQGGSFEVSRERRPLGHGRRGARASTT